MTARTTTTERTSAATPADAAACNVPLRYGVSDAPLANVAIKRAYAASSRAGSLISVAVSATGLGAQ